MRTEQPEIMANEPVKIFALGQIHGYKYLTSMFEFRKTCSQKCNTFGLLKS